MRYAVIDIDGTLSIVGDRQDLLKSDPPDWDMFFERFDEDEVNKNICDLVESIEGKYELVFCTGRPERVRNKTIQWIADNIRIFPYNLLLMRKDDDHRPDVQVKPELLADHFILPSDTAFILEDRNIMVQKWRELGYTCLQVAEGDF